MNSPEIDLDMNLLSSPVPPARGGLCRMDDGSGEVGHVAQKMPSVTVNCPLNYGMNTNAIDAKGGFDNPRPATAMPASQGHAKENTNSNSVNVSVQNRASKECTVAGSSSAQNYDGMMQMVESWKEELCLMNVKNSILLDDLVKLGADF